MKDFELTSLVAQKCNKTGLTEMEPEIIDWIVSHLPDPPPYNTHPFYDFERSLRIIGRREGLTSKEITEYVVQNPENLFEVTGVLIKDINRFYKTVPKKPIKKLLLKPPLNLKDILKSAQETVKETGNQPTTGDGKVKYGPLKREITWAAIHRALRKGLRGLDGCPQNSLSELLNHHDIISTKEAIIFINAKDILTDAARHISEKGTLPTTENDFLAGHFAPDLSKAFRENRVRGWRKFVSPGTHKPHSLSSFFYSAELAVGQGGAKPVSENTAREFLYSILWPRP